MKSQIIITDDGSSSLYVPAIDETYHSTKGAVQESMHIFIGLGLKALSKDKIRILEVGFGTGLNALLTVLHSSAAIEYVSLEKYPVEIEQALQLNYPFVIENEDADVIFRQLHQATWNKKVSISSGFLLHKIQTDFCTYLPEGQFDLIYFDAFSPEKQPEMWDAVQFEKIYKACNPGAVLVTYCAKGQVRRNMISAGFKVERLPGPPGKREVLRAIKEN